MSESPQEIRVIPFSVGDLVSGTHYMTPAEMGAYMRLLIWHYQIGSKGFPANDTLIARRVGCSVAAWLKMKPVVVDKFDLFEGSYIQKRVVRELEYIARKSSQARDNVLKRYDRTPTDVEQTNPGRTTTPSPSPSPSPRGVYSVPKSQDIKTPPYPPSTGTGSGSFDKSGKGGVLPWRVQHHLNDDGWAKARKNAPDWDIYHLAAIYDESVKTMGIPRDANKAFPAWCAKYTDNGNRKP